MCSTKDVIINHAPSISLSHTLTYVYMCVYVNLKWLINIYIKQLDTLEKYFLDSFIVPWNKICSTKDGRGKRGLPWEPLDLFTLLTTWHSISLLSLRLYVPWPHPHTNRIISSGEDKHVSVAPLLTSEEPPWSVANNCAEGNAAPRSMRCRLYVIVCTGVNRGHWVAALSCLLTPL